MSFLICRTCRNKKSCKGALLSTPYEEVMEICTELGGMRYEADKA